jgi:hypothetical protein
MNTQAAEAQQKLCAARSPRVRTWMARASSIHNWDCPELRPVRPPESGKVIEVPEVGGLHHHNERQ